VADYPGCAKTCATCGRQTVEEWSLKSTSSADTIDPTSGSGGIGRRKDEGDVIECDVRNDPACELDPRASAASEQGASSNPDLLTAGDGRLRGNDSGLVEPPKYAQYEELCGLVCRSRCRLTLLSRT
jgi:hypothetical protein